MNCYDKYTGAYTSIADKTMAPIRAMLLRAQHTWPIYIGAICYTTWYTPFSPWGDYRYFIYNYVWFAIW